MFALLKKETDRKSTDNLELADGFSDIGVVKRFLKRFFLVLALLLICLALAVLLLPPKSSPIPVFSAMVRPGEAAFEKKKSLNILLLGVDYNYDRKAQRHTKGARSDTILILRVEPLGKSLSMMSIPRDLYVGIGQDAVHGYDRINAAHSYGGVKLAKETIERVTTLKIDHYVVVKSDVVEDLVDAIGGVPIEVEKQMDWDDNWAGLHIHLKPGKQVLSGSEAVGYCRFRQDAEGDFGRIKRQQKFLGALLKELKRKKHIKKYRELAKIVASKMKTDLSNEQITGLAMLYRNFPLSNITKGRPEVEDYFANGSAYLILAPGEPGRAVRKLFPSLPDPTVAGVHVLIKCPKSLLGEARRVSSRLKEKGFGPIRVRVENGLKPVGKSTVSFRTQDDKATQAVRDTFPQIKVQRKEQKGRPEITLVLRSRVMLSGE